MTCFGAVINSVGVFISLVGAWFVAYEVVNRFKGVQFQETKAFVGVTPPPQKTKAFIDWEILRSKVMILGLILLTLGSLLQILGNWI